MAIFNSYVKLPEGTNLIRVPAGHQTQHLPEYSGEYASCTLMSPPVIQDKKNITVKNSKLTSSAIYKVNQNESQWLKWCTCQTIYPT